MFIELMLHRQKSHIEIQTRQILNSACYFQGTWLLSTTYMDVTESSNAEETQGSCFLSRLQNWWQKGPSCLYNFVCHT